MPGFPKNGSLLSVSSFSFSSQEAEYLTGESILKVHCFIVHVTTSVMSFVFLFSIK
jgi:hypothetical protein